MSDGSTEKLLTRVKTFEKSRRSFTRIALAATTSWRAGK
jgi:hypothetical protein